MCLTTDNAPDLKDPGFDNMLPGNDYCTETDVCEVMATAQRQMCVK